MADVGQEEARTTCSSHDPHSRHAQDFEAARKKALASGAKKFFLEVP